MSRPVKLLAAIFLLLGNTSVASPLDKEMREVERLRGLTFVHGVVQKTIDRSVDRMFKLYDSQVLAFYDPMTHTYFAIRQLPESLAGLSDAGPLRESVVLHELTHALQDQRFSATARDRALQHDTDGELAYHSLLEGEATLVMLDYLLEKSGQSFDEAVKNDFLINALGAASTSDKAIDSAAPPYFVEVLKFPYLEGLKLVVQAYRRGGWKEIDRLHGNPPRTTREVLHPEEYFARFARGARPEGSTAVRSAGGSRCDHHRAPRRVSLALSGGRPRGGVGRRSGHREMRWRGLNRNALGNGREGVRV